MVDTLTYNRLINDFGLGVYTLFSFFRVFWISLFCVALCIPVLAQNNNTDTSALRGVICSVFGLMCSNQPEISTQDLEELLRKATQKEPKYGTFMQSLRAKSNAIEQGSVQELVKQGKPHLDELLGEAEKALTEDLGAETIAIVDKCFGAAKAIRDATSIAKDDSGTGPKAQIDTSNASDCTDAVMERERKVSEELNKKDSEIKELDKNIVATERKIRETEDPKERRRLQEEKKKQEEERAKKERERARLERERMRLQQMRMMIGLALIIAGLFAGPPAGMMMIMSGMNMLSPPSGEGGGKSDGRSSHPSSTEVVEESVSTEHSDQGGTAPADVPAATNETIEPDSAEPDPPIVKDLTSGEVSFKAVPVGDNKHSMKGYYLEDHGNRYILRHSIKAEFKVIIEPSRITPDRTGITVPTPFIIEKFVALVFDKSRNVQIVVKLKDVADQRAIVQNSPLQSEPGMYLGFPKF